MQADAPLVTERFGYLPKEIRGAVVLVDEQNGMWRVTDEFLGSKADGAAFRRTKNLEDIDMDVRIPFGENVKGVCEGDGWVRIHIAKADMAQSTVMPQGAIKPAPATVSHPSSSHIVSLGEGGAVKVRDEDVAQEQGGEVQAKLVAANLQEPARKKDEVAPEALSPKESVATEASIVKSTRRQRQNYCC